MQDKYLNPPIWRYALYLLLKWSLYFLVHFVLLHVRSLLPLLFQPAQQLRCVVCDDDVSACHRTTARMTPKFERPVVQLCCLTVASRVRQIQRVSMERVSRSTFWVSFERVKVYSLSFYWESVGLQFEHLQRVSRPTGWVSTETQQLISPALRKAVMDSITAAFRSKAPAWAPCHSMANSPDTL